MARMVPKETGDNSVADLPEVRIMQNFLAEPKRRPKEGNSDGDAGRKKHVVTKGKKESTLSWPDKPDLEMEDLVTEVGEKAPHERSPNKITDALEDCIASAAAKPVAKGVRELAEWLYPIDTAEPLCQLSKAIEPAATGVAEAGSDATGELLGAAFGVPPGTAKLLGTIFGFCTKKKVTAYAKRIEQRLWQVDALTSGSLPDLSQSPGFHELVNQHIEDVLKDSIKASVAPAVGFLRDKFAASVEEKRLTLDSITDKYERVPGSVLKETLRQQVMHHPMDHKLVEDKDSGPIERQSAFHVNYHPDLTTGKPPSSPKPFREELTCKPLNRLVRERPVEQGKASHPTHTQPRSLRKMLEAPRIGSDFKSSIFSTNAADPANPAADPAWTRVRAQMANA